MSTKRNNQFFHIFFIFLVIHANSFETFNNYCRNYDIDHNCTYCDDIYGVDKNIASSTYGDCIQCMIPYCSSCHEDAYKCDFCFENYSLDTKISSSTYKKCVVCPPNCKNCSSDECYECKKGYGFGPNKECLKCDASFCVECKNDYTQCKYCSKYHGLKYDKCYKCKEPNCTECYRNPDICDNCEDKNLHDDKSGKCVDCNITFDHCLQCSKYQCDRCEEGYYVYGSKCIECPEKCPDSCGKNTCYKCAQSYGMTQSYDCILCTTYDPNCVECKDNECKKCKEGYGFNSNHECFPVNIPNCSVYKDANNCLKCPYNHGLDENNHCLQCQDDLCEKCSKNYTECESCFHSIFLGEDKKCIRCSENCSYCNNGYGFDENKKCRSCVIENCEYCNEDFSKCEGCFSGFYYDTILNQCITNCSDPNCTSCSRSDSRKCFDCKKGTYLNEDKCNICNDHCIDCTIISGNYYCLNCETGFTIVNKTCKKCLSSNCALCEKNNVYKCAVCEPGYISIGGECVECNVENCANCSVTTDVCINCLQGFGLNLIKDSISFGKCLPCNVDHCSNCDGNVNYCKNCEKKFYFHDNKCYLTPFIEEELEWNDFKEDFPLWAIILIIVVGVVIIGLTIFLIIYCCVCKKRKRVEDMSN